MYTCKFCSKECKPNQNSLINHERMCKSNPSRDISFLKNRNFSIESTPCDFCKICFTDSKALGNHRTRCSLNPNRKIQTISEEGKTRSVQKYKTWCENGGWSKELRKKQSNSMRKAVLEHPDSYSVDLTIKRAKKQEYKNEKFHSSWEVIVAKWLDSKNIEWQRKVPPVEYALNESTHLYFPDFYLPDFDLFIEVKGHETTRDLCKWQALSGKISILRKDEIDHIKKYGPDVKSYLIKNIFVKG